MATKGITEYSKEVPGCKGNYGWTAQFDITDGFLRIVQKDGPDIKEAVLLSPRQVKAMLAFLEAQSHA